MSELCLPWWNLTIDVSLKALLLAAVVGCGIRLLRVRRNNLRHAAWVCVLAGMIGLPWLAAVMPAIPVPILRAETAFTGRETAPSPDAEAVELAYSTGHESAADGLDVGVMRDFHFPNEATSTLAGPRGSESQPDPRTASSTDSRMTNLADSAESAAPFEPTSAGRFVVSILPVVAFAIWGLGAVVFGARLLLAIHLTRRMVQRSVPIRIETHPRLKELAEASRSPWQVASTWQNLPLRKSADISVPLTTGALHPQILVPADWQTWPAQKLRNVLIHECAHIRRRDSWTALAAEAMAALYWFHPLAWWLRRKLAVLAEDCCDDAAIGSTGDRAVYARHLLEIASVLCRERRRLHYVGLSMARPSNVERRILSILDTSRPLSQRLTWSLTLPLAAVILPLFAVAAALKPAEESQADSDSQEKTAAAQPSSDKAGASPKAKDDPSDDRAKAAPSNTKQKAYHGKVVGADGQPLAGAEIWLAVSPYDFPSRPAHSTLRRVAVSDSRGEFSFRQKAVENVRQFGMERTSFATLIAKAAGHGCDWLPLQVFENDSHLSDEQSTLEQEIDEFLGLGTFASRTLKLPREAGPVRGRLIDLEGRPLKGVAVSVEGIQNADLTVARDGYETASRARALPRGSINRRNWQALIPPVKTDDNGAFSLSGLGRDQIATVTLSGERVEAERFFVVGTDMEMKRLPHLSTYPKGAQDAFVGINFTLAVGPAIPVSGVVTEFKSGKPIANATVFVERLFSRESIDDSVVQLRVLPDHIRAVTDEQGRYELTGVPPGEGHILNVVPPKSEPWLIAAQTISLDPGQPAATVDVQVFRGIWIEGQVTDADTGEGVEGFVDYLALQDNPNIPQAFGLQDAWEMERFPIAAEGRYRTAGLPGPGVLLVRSFGKKVYPRSAGAEKIEGYQREIEYLPTTPSGRPMSNWHLVQFVNPEVGTESFNCDLTLSAGVSLVGHIIGPDGSQTSEIEALGLVEKGGFFEPLKDDKFTVTDYQPDVPRNLFFKTADRTLVGHLHLAGKPPADLTVRLQPAVTVRGKLIETETDGPAAKYRFLCRSSEKGEFRIDDETDKNGRFEIKGLMAGNVYQMDCINVQLFVSGKNRFTIDLSEAKPGDVVELGEVTGKNAKRKE